MPKLLERLAVFWNRKVLKKRTPKFYRGQEKFRNRYPQYSIGIGSYGLPIVQDWNEGTILSVGAYTSIADEVLASGQSRLAIAEEISLKRLMAR